MFILFFIIGFFVGIFVLAQVIYPLLFVIPKARRLEKQNKLAEPIPVTTIIAPVIIWLIILGIVIYLVNWLFKSGTLGFLAGLGLSAIVVIIQIPKKNQDLEWDFQQTWGRYLKEEGSGVISYTHPQKQEKEERKRRIMELFKEKERITNNEVQERFNISDATATNYLEELEKEGKIKQVGETGRGVYYKIKNS